MNAQSPRSGGVSEFTEADFRESADASESSAGRGTVQLLHLLTVQELFALTSPPALIDGVLPSGTLVGATGKRATKKSLLVLGWGLCLATGLAWHGRRVSPGIVVYIAAEGARGLRKRVDAWCRSNGFDRTALEKTIFVYPRSINFLTVESIDALIKSLLGLEARPVLIIVDTLSRCFVGGDENSAQDMSVFVESCERLQRATDATVLVVHHVNKNGTGPRGSSVFECAVETLITVESNGDIVTVSCDKQKDDAEFETIRLRKVVVDVGQNERGEQLTSCVLVPESSEKEGSDAESLGRLRDRSLCQCMWDRVGMGEIDAATLACATKFSKSEFQRVTARLRKAGCIELVRSGKPNVYRLTDQGKFLVVPDVPESPNGDSGTTTQGCPKSQASRPRKGAKAGTGTNVESERGAGSRADAEVSRA